MFKTIEAIELIRLSSRISSGERSWAASPARD